MYSAAVVDVKIHCSDPAYIVIKPIDAGYTVLRSPDEVQEIVDVIQISSSGDEAYCVTKHKGSESLYLDVFELYNYTGEKK